MNHQPNRHTIMTTELITRTVTDPVPRMQLVAQDANELRAAQRGLLDFFRAKVAAAKIERDDAQTNLDIAARAGFKLSTYARPANAAAKRVTYAEKALAAVEAGYLIVPNMPVNIFAIRTNRELPAAKDAHAIHATEQAAQALPAGEGRYVDPRPTCLSRQETKTNPHTGKEYQSTVYWPVQFDPVDYPIEVANPVVMNATAAAMSRQLFDEMGVVAVERRGDPIILGRLRQNASATSPILSFLIAWYLDTKTL